MKDLKKNIFDVLGNIYIYIKPMLFKLKPSSTFKVLINQLYNIDYQRLIYNIYFFIISTLGNGKINPTPLSKDTFSRSINSSLKCHGKTR